MGEWFRQQWHDSTTHRGILYSAAVIVLYAIVLVVDALDKLAGVSSFFSSTPLFQSLAERGLSMTAALYWWIKTAVHISMLVLLVHILREIHRQRRKEQELADAHTTIHALQTELDRLTSIRPRLIVEPLVRNRRIPRSLFPADDTSSDPGNDPTNPDA